MVATRCSAAAVAAGLVLLLSINQTEAAWPSKADPKRDKEKQRLDEAPKYVPPGASHAEFAPTPATSAVVTPKKKGIWSSVSGLFTNPKQPEPKRPPVAKKTRPHYDSAQANRPRTAKEKKPSFLSSLFGSKDASGATTRR